MSAEAQQRNVKVKYQSTHESLLTSLTEIKHARTDTGEIDYTGQWRGVCHTSSVGPARLSAGLTLPGPDAIGHTVSPHNQVCADSGVRWNG